MAKKRYRYKFRKSKKYEFKKSINYEKGKIGFEFIVAVKDGSNQGQGYYFWDIDLTETTASPLNVRQLLSASNEFDVYKKMYSYYKVNGILIESFPSAFNSRSLAYQPPVQIQPKFTTQVSYNDALILNPYQKCSKYVKSYQTEYISFDDNSDHHNLGLITLLFKNTSLMQTQCPIFHIRISLYISFKKNINV